ncbi:PREDICTED: uncharacterized protein LOC109242944 isoform X2 [Nicotiana attenuata]|uniref:uncharacterized protein LOC109242944 isoform X2 n=1 Tax=Nicotiana attenuata TaxID=49451 RepID=UPI0009050EA2|nr:PREDICTED: uncharacterized protein LOC109242944 isoform X2 [Nicotiana attenuata]
MPHAVPDLEDWVRKLAATSSHAERCWRDLARGRWEAKNHGLGDVAEMRLKPTWGRGGSQTGQGQERKRASPSDTPKPKKSKARKPKDDFAALPVDVDQRLRDVEEEGEDVGYELVPRKRGSVKASTTAEPVMAEENNPRTEEIAESTPRKAPESSGVKDASSRDKQMASVPEGSDSRALRKGESAPSDSLGAINIDDSPLDLEFFEGQFWEAQSLETLDVGTTHDGEDIFRGCHAWVDDVSDLDATIVFGEAHRLLNQDVTLHREAFTKYQAELSRCEDNLKRLTEERDALKRVYVQKEEELKDLRAELAQARKEEAELDKQLTNLLKEYGLDPTVEANTSISQL